MATTVFAQNANVIELEPTDTVKAQKAWDNLQKAQMEWESTRITLGNKYTNKVPCVASLSGTWPPSSDQVCIHQPKEGFESGFELSKDFKFIIPKSPPTNLTFSGYPCATIVPTVQDVPKFKTAPYWITAGE